MNKTPLINKLKENISTLEGALKNRSLTQFQVVEYTAKKAAYEDILKMVRDHRDWEK